jgi:hypothetical protein
MQDLFTRDIVLYVTLQQCTDSPVVTWACKNDGLRYFWFIPFQEVPSHNFVLTGCPFICSSGYFLVWMAFFTSNSFLNVLPARISVKTTRLCIKLSPFWLLIGSSDNLELCYSMSTTCWHDMDVNDSKAKVVSTTTRRGISVIWEGRNLMMLKTFQFKQRMLR